MSNKLCKCGKVGEISCPHDDRCGNPMNNTDNTLPEELRAKIKSASIKQYPGPSDRGDSEKLLKVMAKRVGYIAGATEYAPYKVKYEQARIILKDLLDTFEAGAWPDVPSKAFITEVKSFLDGTQ